MSACVGPSDDSHPPLLLVISLDTLRADAIGTLSGVSPSPTPSLDRLGEDSVVFERAFSQMPHTLPSHMSIFTGLYPDTHGVIVEEDALATSFDTLPSLLQAAGYRTVGFATCEWLEDRYGFGRGFDRYEILPHKPIYADRVNAAALEEIRDSDGSKPLFLFLHYYDAHSDFEQGTGNRLPYFSPPEFRETVAASASGDEFCDEEGRCNTRFLIASDTEGREVSAEMITVLKDLYQAGVSALDAELGRLFDELDAMGLYEEALIVLTSDHGEEFREHNRFIHSQPYEPTIRVPLFVKLPGQKLRGTRITTLAQSVDILPTVLDLLALDFPAYVSGRSLVPSFTDEDAPPPPVFARDSLTKTRYGLRDERFKFIANLAGDWRELYDLAKDPGEQHNLVAERAERAASMEEELRKRVEALGQLGERLAAGYEVEGQELTTEEEANLKALGYLN